MDNDKIATAPIVPPDEQIEYYYNDVHKDDIKDIAVNTELPTEEKKEPEKPAEPVKPEEPAKPDVQSEENNKKLAEETAKAVLDQQEAYRVASETKAKIEAEAAKPAPDPKAEYQKIVDDFTAKEGRTPTWDELAVKLEERTVEKVFKMQEERAKQAETARQEQAKKVELENQSTLSYINDELSDLYKGNKLTPIKDPNNPSDQGVVEKNALFKRWEEVNTERRAKGLPNILSATRILEFYYTKPQAQPPGADLPIAGNKVSDAIPSKQQEYTNEDLKKPWSWFRRQ